MKTIGITGGTGFIGRHLTQLLVEKGYKVIIFSRSAGKKGDGNVSYAHWDPDKREIDQAALGKIDGIIQLAGASVAEKRLTEKRKQEVIDSRVQSTNFLISQLKVHAPGCKSFIAASATGFYGPDRPGMMPFTEASPPYNDFLGETCRQWEAATEKAGNHFRTVIIRIGIVLGKDGGAFPELAKPLSFGVMPILGSGKQVVCWIDIDDLARLFLFMLENEGLSGIFNGVAPNPVTHKELMYAIAKEKGGLKIPVPVPAFVLKIALGEMSTEILKSCTVSAAKTLGTGFTFRHPDLSGTLKRLSK
ncbi:MAG: hypothetical protein K0Q79_2642 [Flavipsychrobacter sp.]|jgi:uncharacterized protein (TIGR01777 family)|nr:hypothetical protein [Flavipsychrobacter sp.]